MINKFFCSILVRMAGLCAPIVLLTGAASDTSLYQLPISWESESGKKTELAQFSGKPAVLTLMYTRCGSTCPMTIARLKEIERRAKGASLSPEFVLVSLDPKEDTPQRLTDYKKAKGLGNNWHLLHGAEQDVRTLSVFLGYSYREDPQQKEIFHSNKVILLDKEGNIALTLEGVDSDPAPLLEKLSALSGGSR